MATTSQLLLSTAVIRCIFALNNIGVTMIANGQYDLAIITLEDALLIVKSYSMLFPTIINVAKMNYLIDNLYTKALQNLQEIVRKDDYTMDFSSSRCYPWWYVSNVITWNSIGCFCYCSDTKTRFVVPNCTDATANVSASGTCNHLPTSCRKVQQQEQLECSIHPIRIEDVNVNILDSRRCSCPIDTTTNTNSNYNSNTLFVSSGLESLNLEISLLIHNLGLAYLCSESYNDISSRRSSMDDPENNPTANKQRQGITVAKELLSNSLLLTLKEHEQLNRLLVLASGMTEAVATVSSTTTATSTIYDTCLLQYLLVNFHVLIDVSMKNSICTRPLLPIVERMSNSINTNINAKRVSTSCSCSRKRNCQSQRNDTLSTMTSRFGQEQQDTTPTTTPEHYDDCSKCQCDCHRNTKHTSTSNLPSFSLSSCSSRAPAA